MYTSPIVQNEILSASNDIILSKLVGEINQARGFSVLADETTDISNIEQLSLCARYLKEVQNRYCVNEVFLRFVPVYDVTGKGLAKTIQDELSNLHIDTSYWYGQGYDGAAAMSGRLRGAQAIIRENHPLALYVHCVSHGFNLAIVQACKVAAIAQCIGIVKSEYDFFNTPKRQNVLTETIVATANSEISRQRLKNLCLTRWVESNEAVLTCDELMVPVVHALDVISEWDDADTAAAADGLRNSLLNPKFLVTLRILCKTFALSLPLCRQLQTKNQDLAQAVQLVENLRESLQELRDHADERFHEIFSDVEQTCESFDIDAKIIPLPARRRTSVNSSPVSTAEEYYRVTIFIPFLDSFLQQLDDRLLSHRELLSSFSCLLPKKNDLEKELDKETVEKATKLRDTYEVIFNCTQAVWLAELNQWYRYLHRVALPKDAVPENALEALDLCSKSVFPNVFEMLKILAVIPVTTNTNERSFSTLRFLKSYLRNSCSADRLNGLAHLFINRNVACTADEVLNEMSKKKRRLQFSI